MTDDVDPEESLRLARDIASAYRAQGGPTRSRRASGKPRKSRREGREDAAPISDFLQELVNQQGWNDSLAATRVFTDWALIVGPQVAQHTRVEHFEEGIVHVAASSTAWAKELRLLAPRIVARLNEVLGDGRVQRIEVRGPQAPSWNHGPRAIRGRGQRDTYG